MARIVRVLEYYGPEEILWEYINTGIVPANGEVAFSNRDDKQPQMIICSQVLKQTGNNYVLPGKEQTRTFSLNTTAKRGRKGAKRKRQPA